MKTLARLADWLFTSDAHQRIRLRQVGTAMALMLASVFEMDYLAWAGFAPLSLVTAWTVGTVLAFAAFFGYMRIGRNRNFADPSLTVPLMCLGFLCGATAYAMAGRARGAVFPILVVILMFGMYSLPPRTVRAMGLVAVALFGSTMALMAWLRPEIYEPKIEAAHFTMIGIMLPAASMLAGKLSRLRERLRTQKTELTVALARIQDLATRDELTGLVNRRHMAEVLQLEHQRCVRSGHVFCIAVIDLDHFKQVNDNHGHPVGDDVLRCFAGTALGAIRVSDVLARWGGEEFLMLMSDTRGPLARLCVERLRERAEALRINANGQALQVTMSAGVTEHRAGESMEDTIERADQAVYAAKAGGRNRVVLS